MKAAPPLPLAALTLPALLFALLAVSAAPVPVVKTKTESFTDVTLVSETDTHLFLKHSRGVANIRISDLDTEALTALGAKQTGAVLAGPRTDAQAGDAPEVTAPAADSSIGKFPALPIALKLPPIERSFVLVLLGLCAGAWLFFSWCSMLICKKAGSDPGLLVWVPLLQMLPLIRAAGMSGWWFLAMFVPVLNLVTQVIWSVNIAKARGKGLLCAILLILPGTNFFAFLYLAFSSASAPEEESTPSGPLRLDPLPSQ